MEEKGDWQEVGIFEIRPFPNPMYATFPDSLTKLAITPSSLLLLLLEKKNNSDLVK